MFSQEISFKITTTSFPDLPHWHPEAVRLKRLVTETDTKMPVFKHPEYPKETLLRLESLVPCRESQVSTLLSIFGEVMLIFSVSFIWLPSEVSALSPPLLIEVFYSSVSYWKQIVFSNYPFNFLHLVMENGVKCYNGTAIICCQLGPNL